MVSSADFWAFYADHRPPSFLFSLNFLYLLDHGPAFGFGKKNEAADCDDTEDEEDIESVETMSSYKAKAKWTECGCKSAERGNNAHSNGSNSSRIQFTHVHLKEAKEERDASTKDKNHNQLNDTMIAGLTILRPLKKDQDEADK